MNKNVFHDDDTFDVAIVGYGPTGLALAYWLGKAGHKVVVIERWPDLYKLPRASGVDSEIMRLFQRMGVAETIAADSSVMRATIIRDTDGVLLDTLRSGESEQGWQAHYSLFQPNLERTLDGIVRGTGNVWVLQGWLAGNIETSAAGGVRVHAASGVESDGKWVPSGPQKEISARWLIGADGANSAVRKLLQSATRDLGYHARALVIFAERLDPKVGADMPDGEVGMMLPRPYVVFRASGKRYTRWEFIVLDGESSAEMSAESKAWELIERWGFTPHNSRLVRHTVFEFRTLVVENWREGNILLAGDAAHVMPPFQGQGMCSGQRDAAALAWRLDLVLRGIADAALLDSYTDERKPHVLELTKNSSERGKTFWVTDPIEARKRDARMREGLANAALKSVNLKSNAGGVPALISGLLMKEAGGVVLPAGRLSAQFTVSHLGREALLDEFVGAHWLLLAADRSLLKSLSAAERQLLKLLDARTLVLGSNDVPDEFEDIHGDYARWLNKIGCQAVVIRPDCYLFGGASEASGLHALLDSLRAQLHLQVKLA